MKSALINKDLKTLQALVMIQHKIMGKGVHAIAKEMNISHDTVERRLAWANKAGLFVQYEQKILSELVPVGFEAIKTAMQDGDAETAMDLFKSLGILRDPKAPKTQAQVEEDDSLQRAIGEIRTQEALTIDGEVISGGRNSLAGLLTGETAEEGAIETDIISPAPIGEDAAKVETSHQPSRYEVPVESSEDGSPENEA